MLMPNCDLAFAADRRAFQPKPALVIGNSSYQNAPILPSTTKDADAMAESFKVAGFDVVTAQNNLGIKEFLTKLRQFEDEAANADIAVVYYAGHGIEVAGINFMIPVDAKLANDRDARDEIVSLDRLLEAVEGAKRLRLVILDACRDNPLAQTMKRQREATLRGATGLALVEPTANNSLIAYAAKAGAAAEDGNANHSPYTTALLTHLFVPGLDIRLALGRARETSSRRPATARSRFSPAPSAVRILPSSPGLSTWGRRSPERPLSSDRTDRPIENPGMMSRAFAVRLLARNLRQEREIRLMPHPLRLDCRADTLTDAGRAARLASGFTFRSVARPTAAWTPAVGGPAAHTVWRAPPLRRPAILEGDNRGSCAFRPLVGGSVNTDDEETGLHGAAHGPRHQPSPTAHWLPCWSDRRAASVWGRNGGDAR
jgi:hypothetical protein